MFAAKFMKPIVFVIATVWSLVAAAQLAIGQSADADPIKVGYLIEVSLPMGADDADRLINQLAQLNENAPDGGRITAVLHYIGDRSDVDTGSSGSTTAFEDALKLARAITGPSLRKVRVVSLVEGLVNGHSTLPIIASEMILVSGDAIIADASIGESSSDETVQLAYQSIAAKRGLIAPDIVVALVDPGVELAKVVQIGGEEGYAAGDRLRELRDEGQVVSEEVWSAAGVPLRIDAKQLRSTRIAAGLAESTARAAELLDLGKLTPVDSKAMAGPARGVLLDITGAISSNRVRRWQSNLASTVGGDINTWIVNIDSGGGSLDDSAALAAWFAKPDQPIQVVAGFVRAEARGDASLLAVACQPLYLSPDARLGGLGADSIRPDDVYRYDELIEQIAVQSQRPAALVRGLLNPDLEVYRYKHRRTGRVRYATEDDIVAGVEDPVAEQEKWIRGEQIDLAGGFTVAEAITLGLAEGESASIDQVAKNVGLESTPDEVADRGLVRFVENLGRSHMLAFLLIFIGFSALSAEANAPGLGFPGFLAIVCFALWFWIQFLNGTAEWLELIVFGVGIACIAVEVFVVPGFGVFGVGGLALTVLGVVLMSQTFIIPRNPYQLSVLSRGVWVALAGAAGMFGGFVAIRLLFPHVPVLRGLVMEAGDEAFIAESEKLGDYSELLGQVGRATTPLRPSGKAQFGDQIVQVVSDGTMVEAGQAIRVCEVHATKVVVERTEQS